MCLLGGCTWQLGGCTWQLGGCTWPLGECTYLLGGCMCLLGGCTWQLGECMWEDIVHGLIKQIFTNARQPYVIFISLEGELCTEMQR